jgi:Transposase, Mutator family
MGKRIGKSVGAHELEPVSLSELIHQHVRVAIETAVHEELRAALGATPYERSEVRRGYRNGIKGRTLTGPTGPSRSPCPAPPSSTSLARRNGRPRSSRAINGECRRSMM